MRECWLHNPGKRPTFTELVLTIDKTLRDKATRVSPPLTLARGGGGVGGYSYI